MNNVISVLDKGYVRLVDTLGTDLSVVNAARTSFAKEHTEFDESDERLMKFLAREGHLSPWRHCFATFEIKAPLMVARQYQRYLVGSTHLLDDAINEASRRYITMEPEFYFPDAWRLAPENKKQGSGADAPPEVSTDWNRRLGRLVRECQTMYDEALADGIAPEQARLLLPAYGMYTIWRWSASLQSICHFLSQRLAHDAQQEIQEYARAVYELIRPKFPRAVDALVTPASL